MASSSLLGARVTSYRWLLPNCSLRRLACRAPVLVSAFVGEKGKLANAAVVCSGHENSRNFKPLAAGQRELQTSVSPLMRRSLHWRSLEFPREFSSLSLSKRKAERKAVAQVGVVVAEEERLVGSGRKNGFSGYARREQDDDEDDSEDDESDSDDEGDVLRVDSDSTDDEDELAIASLGVAEEIVDALAKRGITNLFPIQRAVLTPAMEGRDLIGRAKTGTGKTLAFGMPIMDKIIRENEDNRSSRRSGRRPQALVLAPTRELAKQVEREFMETAPSLSTICVYGGVSITGQQRQLQKGVDIAVGTPGRIIDLIERDSLNLQEVQFLVLDEADQMLAVGFEEDVEKILEELPAERQSMLFSATMPAWVKKLAKKYLKSPLTIDLVGESDEKLAEGIKLFAMQTVASAKRTILNDLITVYAKGEKTIVFTQTKREADAVALAMGKMVGCEALHGDITQAQRDKTLNKFREGRFTVLVATDVAARGLDIPNVDLVVHYEIPNDPETFVHRSGRTGRAGKAGTAILMHSGNQARTMKRIEQDVGCRFQKVTPPTLDEVLGASSDQAKELIRKVHPDLIETFLPTAEKLLEGNGPRALAGAIAILSGFSEPPTSRSLITFEEGLTTLRIIRTDKSGGGRLISPRAVMGTLAEIYPAAADQIGKIKIIDESNVEGAVFDLPDDVAKALLAKPQDGRDIIDVPKALPRIEDDDERGGDNYGRFPDGGGRGGGYGRRGGRDDRRSSNRFGDRSGGGGRFDDSNRSRARRSDDDWNSGASRRDSRRSDRGGRGASFSGACFICNKPGHRASECPKGRS